MDSQDVSHSKLYLTSIKQTHRLQITCLIIVWGERKKKLPQKTSLLIDKYLFFLNTDTEKACFTNRLQSKGKSSGI